MRLKAFMALRLPALRRKSLFQHLHQSCSDRVELLGTAGSSTLPPETRSAQYCNVPYNRDGGTKGCSEPDCRSVGFSVLPSASRGSSSTLRNRILKRKDAAPIAPAPARHPAEPAPQKSAQK